MHYNGNSKDTYNGNSKDTFTQKNRNLATEQLNFCVFTQYNIFLRWYNDVIVFEYQSHHRIMVTVKTCKSCDTI